MKTYLLRLALLLAPALLVPSLASAATANFQGNCTSNATNTTCTLDALRPASNPSSCPGSFIWKFSWDYGDGTGSGLTGNNQVTHTWANSGGAYVISLTVLCWDGNTPTKQRVLCISFGVPGCIQSGVGWN